MAVTWFDRFLLNTARKMAGPAPLNVELGWEGNDSQRPASISGLRLKNRRALYALMRNPGINFGELYMSGDLEIEGNLLQVLEALYGVPPGIVARAYSKYLGWMHTNSRRDSRRNIHHHYDLSNDFYQLWLDREMVYTCAYFPKENTSLEEAQRAKMDLVCRKLWLRPGEIVVEAGCGWGALALHMAAVYGVRVRAFNISREQITFARERARREGLSSRVEFIEDDYRNITGKSDVFVSVGMLEHVGKAHYEEFGRVIDRVIGDRGRGLLHFIGRTRPAPLNAWIRKRIFPGGYVPVLREAMSVLEPQNLSVLDVENLRFHYARTLEHWLSRFERSYDQVAARFGTAFARMWRLYLAGSTAAFRLGNLQLFQVLFAGRACREIPWTRDRLYRQDSKDSGQDSPWIHAMS
jgi:cyclopropane-fatty-acyl-phospholipid synthase